MSQLDEIEDYAGDEPEEIRACPFCGSEMERIECDTCHGEGGFDSDALMEEDPLWYDGVEWEDCSDCHGEGYYWHCFNHENHKG